MAEPVEAPREVAVGVVRKPFGLRGEVYVHPDADLGDEFDVGERYRVRDPGPGVPDTLVVESTLLHRGMRIVGFEGIEDRDAAAALRDTVLWREADPFDLAADAFWADELVGRPVTDEAGTLLGTLTGVRDGTAHDYLVVTDPGGTEVLVPAVEEFVTVEPERVVLRPVPGLFDPSEATE